MSGTRRDRLVSWALGAIAGISIGFSIIDILNIAPGWAARLTPLFVGVLLLYVVLERERVESVKYIVRRLDRGMRQMRSDLRRAGGRAAGTPTRSNLPDTYRSIEWKGMIFRSNTEVRIAKALENANVLYLPPVKARMNQGKERTGREIDFLIFHKGRWGILEVDGPYHRPEADAARDELLRDHGISIIQRFDSEACYHDAPGVVRAFLARLSEEPSPETPSS
ncbi:MAG: hypothetical protein ACUVS2_00130 [Candidatus Flexifilum sp.]